MLLRPSPSTSLSCSHKTHTADLGFVNNKYFRIGSNNSRRTEVFQQEMCKTYSRATKRPIRVRERSGWQSHCKKTHACNKYQLELINLSFQIFSCTFNCIYLTLFLSFFCLGPAEASLQFLSQLYPESTSGPSPTLLQDICREISVKRAFLRT